MPPEKKVIAFGNCYRIFTIYDNTMAYSKKDAFPSMDARLAAFAKALSHPARIAILKTLADGNRCVCGEIVEVIPLAQSTVSQHLKELKKAGLIKGEVEGQRICYCLNPDIARTLADQLRTFVQSVAPANSPPGECTLPQPSSQINPGKRNRR